MDVLSRKHRTRRLAQLLLRGVACTLLSLGLLGAAGVLISQQAAAAEPWFLLEFADSRPPCVDAPANSRCIGTVPKTTVFEMRDGERIEMPSTSTLPPAWAAFDQMWVYAPAVAGAYGRRTIELTATPMGARLIIQDGEYEYLQSIPLSRWIALEARNQPKLWVRVTPAS
jgi:hypothetical protein